MKKLIKAFALCAIFVGLFAACTQAAKVEELDFQPVESADIDFSKIKPDDLKNYMKAGGPLGQNDYGVAPAIDDDGVLIIKAASFAMWTYSFGDVSYADLSETTEMKVKAGVTGYSNEHEDWGGLRFVLFDTNGGASSVDINWGDMKDDPKTFTLNLLPKADGGNLDVNAYGYENGPADLSKIQKIGIVPNAAVGTVSICTIKFAKPKA